MEFIKALVRPSLVLAKSSKVELPAASSIYWESSAAVLKNAAHQLFGLGFRCRNQSYFEIARPYLLAVSELVLHAFACAFDVFP
ncbi:hypothetical protein A9179_12545 [Pseudomonas alcaligenes]|uniref:Uncharacterized protein n=1 Tax=Aquipseudomonas alcaligenes TaxID=43263 RepID=A0ABR7S0H9_AQUAC|nr:hypothetical protein [Pseudomonas alcaligenes]